jgi:prepilin-type N-terminal cleavage/methylation domain-containing protein
MKTIKSDGRRVAGGAGDDVRSLWHPSRSSLETPAPTKRPSRHAQRGLQPSRPAFTLIELLVVIAIMAVLAALLLPVAGAVKKRQYINHAQAELASLETAIERYKAAYGFYPPDSTNPLVNQLFFELVGTTNTGSGATPFYLTLDNHGQMGASAVNNIFGAGGFMNCTKPNGGEDASAARDFLPDVKLSQMAFLTNIPATYTNVIIITAVGGPDTTYQPLGAQDLNPWRYISSSPTNNPGSYDLWVQLSISGKKYLVCNWNSQVQRDSPLP